MNDGIIIVVVLGWVGCWWALSDHQRLGEYIGWLMVVGFILGISALGALALLGL